MSWKRVAVGAVGGAAVLFVLAFVSIWLQPETTQPGATPKTRTQRRGHGFDFSERYEGHTFDALVRHLRAAGLSVGLAYVAPFRALRGATDGCRIDIEGEKVAVFSYDSRTQAGREGVEGLRATGWVEDGTYIINGTMVLLCDPEHRAWTTILEAFSSFKEG